MHWHRLGSLVLIGAAGAAFSGCAEERDPINRVEANALPKTLFAGEWYYQQTVVDVPATYTVSMVGNTNYNGMHRIRWDVQENFLYARKAYEVVKGGSMHASHESISEDTGEFKGDIVGAWAIKGHFDIKRGYNPSTGEENNVVEENSSDCKWYECKYVRVDWSTNQAIDYMFIDSDEDIIKQPVAFYNQDADPRWKPTFDAQAGYIDITTAMAVDPGKTTMEYSSGSYTYPTCWFFAYAHASCNTQIIKIRNSFMRRDPNRDYQPREHLAPYNEWFGFFTNERHTWENHYGLSQLTKRRMINRHNLWTEHHDLSKSCTKNDDCKTTPGSTCDKYIKFHKYDVATDSDNDGLPDAFEKDTKWAGLDSQNMDSDSDGILDADDDADGNGTRDIEDFWKWDRESMHYACTIPAKDRIPRPIAYYDTGFFPRDLVCDKDDKGTGPCKAWKFTANKTTRDTNWSALHHISNNYDDALWKVFLRGAWGWSDADFQKWITSKTNAAAMVNKKADLEKFGSDKYGYYAFTICTNNPVKEDDPWPCRFNRHSFAEAKELMEQYQLKFNDLSYKQAKKMIADGKIEELRKRGAPFIRHGDIRYHNVNYVRNFYDGWRLLGLGPSHTDPRTGENLAGVANVYALNDWAATYIQEMVQLLNGDIDPISYINGVNLNSWLSKNNYSHGQSMKSDTVTAEQLKEMYSSMVQPWMKKVAKLGSPQLLDTYANQMSQKQLRKMLLTRTAQSGLYDPARSPINPSVIKGTMLEKRMIDSDVLLAAGYAPASVKTLTDNVLKNASPVRGTGLFKFLEVQEEFRMNLANKRNMYFMAMADDSMVGLAYRLKEKYKTLSVADRAQKVWEEARDKIMIGVLTHEMGHTFGLHHNWGGSEDVMNFHPEYWTLRTNNFKDTKLCSNWKNAKANDGQLCPFMVQNKGINDFQLGKTPQNISQNIDSMYEYAYSSLMDYSGRYSNDARGLGRYDVAAIMYGHADKMEAFKVLHDPSNSAGEVPSGKTTDSNRINIFEEWSDRDGSILVFTSQGPSSFHYTNWYGIMKQNLYKESNRVLVDYDKFTKYCYQRSKNGDKKAGVKCDTLDGDDRRDIGYFTPSGNTKLVRVPYVFCTYTRGDISDGCNTRDYGSDQYERMKQHVNNWDTWNVLKNFTRYQFPWDADKYVSRNYKRTYKVLKNFNNGYSLYQGLFRQWFSESVIGTFYTDPVWGWGTYTKAMSDAFNMAMRTLAMPDIKNFELGTWADGQQVYKEAEYQINFKSNLANSRYFATAWSDTNYEDVCGLNFWECLHHVGFYLDKMMALEVLSDPVTYFVARDTAEDIREWRISFFDNYTTQIVDFFGSMLSEDFDGFSPYFDSTKPSDYKSCNTKADCGGGTCDPATKRCVCGHQNCVVQTTEKNSAGTPYTVTWNHGMAWRNYTTPTLDVKKPTTGAAVEASTRFTLQIYSVVFGMLGFQQNFDNEFVARGRMWRKGMKNGWTVTPSAKIKGLIQYADPNNGSSYVGVAYQDDRGIAQKMIIHANRIKARSSYCTPEKTPPVTPAPLDLCAKGVTKAEKAAADAELYNYSQLMDILVQVTSIYDNLGQNWSDDYENP